ncbi:MAG: MAPEG family protein, partial [Phenylobacterium sp.]
VRQRRRHRVTVGHADIPELAQAVRAFGNASEYVPAGIAALAVMAVVGVPALAIHLIGLTLLLGRLSHAIGLSRSTGATLPRAIGVVATWLAYVGAAVALLFYAIP